jgi:hypothetical protein
MRGAPARWWGLCLGLALQLTLTLAGLQVSSTGRHPKRHDRHHRMRLCIAIVLPIPYLGDGGSWVARGTALPHAHEAY